MNFKNNNNVNLEDNPLGLGFILLSVFCVLRPITLINLNVGIFGLNLLEIFAISISYLLLIAVLLNVKYLEFDLVSFIIVLFCFYCLFSLFWGSKLKVVFQIILPFIIFFSARLFVKNKNNINLLLSFLIISYLIPLFGSFYQIIQGNTISLVESLTGIERHSGLFTAIRPLANAMFFFSVLFYLKTIIFWVEERFLRYTLVFMIIISLYCAFKSYTRSILLGIYILWGIGFLGYKKKYFFIFLIMSLILGLFFLANLQQIFFKTQEFDIQTASSGRTYIWAHNIGLYKTYSLQEKILGRGLGVGSESVFGKDWEIWSSHNDYLHLLMHLGGVGLLLYLLIQFVILFEVLSKDFPKKIKYFYLGFIFSVIFINFSSGIITYQLPTAQLFWMIIGFINVFKTQNLTTICSNKTVINSHNFSKEDVGLS